MAISTFYQLRIFIILFFIGSYHIANAQKETTREDKMYFRSGFGFSFPVGDSNDYLSTKFSTSLGLVISLGKGPLFLYPKLDLHAYGFDQMVTETDYQTLGKNGRATTYLLNMALGYRKAVNNFGFYGFLGGGGGMILTPRVKLTEDGNIATLSNKAMGMPIMETGAGVDYSLGSTFLFFEAGYLHGFTKLQNRSFQSVPINLGVKTNISKLFF